MNQPPQPPKQAITPESQTQMELELQQFYAKTQKKKTDQKKSTPAISFSPAAAILKDITDQRSFDVIRIKQALDQKPFRFDFGAGDILVFRYQVECVDAELMLYVPAIKSFSKKIEINKFYEIASKRNFHYQVFEEGINEWILYVNRIKNISHIPLKIKDRLVWKSKPKSKMVKFDFDESWLEKSLPISNNLVNLTKFCESPRDINRSSLLSSPIHVLRLEYQKQIEIVERSGSIIKNLEYNALLHNKKMIKLYVPYFLKDIVSNLIEKLLNMNIIINRLKVFYREGYTGLLWDCTLSGFIFRNKEYEQKMLSIKDGKDFFDNRDGEDLLDYLDQRRESRLQGEENRRKREQNRNRKHSRERRRSGNQKQYSKRDNGRRNHQRYDPDYHKDYDRRYHQKNRRVQDRNQNRGYKKMHDREYYEDYNRDFDRDYDDQEDNRRPKRKPRNHNQKRNSRKLDRDSDYQRKNQNKHSPESGKADNLPKKRNFRRKRESKKWKQVQPQKDSEKIEKKKEGQQNQESDAKQ